MDAELEGVPATDELRERLAMAMSALKGSEVIWDEDRSRADAILPLVVAVVAEARTEGAIAELEAAADLILAPSEHLRDSATCRDIAYDLHERAAALRGVGNQKVERWSANRLEEVLREGLPDQNAEPCDYSPKLGERCVQPKGHGGIGHIVADQKGTEQ